MSKTQQRANYRSLDDANNEIDALRSLVAGLTVDQNHLQAALREIAGKQIADRGVYSAWPEFANLLQQRAQIIRRLARLWRGAEMSDLTDALRANMWQAEAERKDAELRAVSERCGAAEAQVAELREALRLHHWKSDPFGCAVCARLASSTGEERQPERGGE